MSHEPRSRGERRRQEILAAARACFLEQGFEATTIDQIRARSGASTGSIYHLFAGKEAILGALLIDAVTEWQQSLVGALEATASAEEAVRAAVHGYADFVEADLERARFMLTAPRASLAAADRERLAEQNRAFASAVSKKIKGFAERGELRPVPPDLLGAVLLGPSHEHARAYLAGHAKRAPRAAARHFADAAWAAVRAAS